MTSFRTLNKLSNQEIFDKVVLAVLEQGSRAYGNRPGDLSQMGCMYRTPDGRKCAVGQLLSDEEQDLIAEKRLHSLGVRDLTEFLGAELDESKITLLQHLQNVHDITREGDRDVWRREFARNACGVAHKNELNPLVAAAVL